MICQRFPTAGCGFRKALPDWNLLSRVGLDLGSARGLSQLQREVLRMPSNLQKMRPYPSGFTSPHEGLIHQQSTLLPQGC